MGGGRSFSGKGVNGLVTHEVECECEVEDKCCVVDRAGALNEIEWRERVLVSADSRR